MTSTWPPPAAKCSGLRPASVLHHTDTPARISRCATSVLPWAHARCRAVQPSPSLIESGEPGQAASALRSCARSPRCAAPSRPSGAASPAGARPLSDFAGLRWCTAAQRRERQAALGRREEWGVGGGVACRVAGAAGHGRPSVGVSDKVGGGHRASAGWAVGLCCRPAGEGRCGSEKSWLATLTTQADQCTCSSSCLCQSQAILPTQVLQP